MTDTTSYTLDQMVEAHGEGTSRDDIIVAMIGSGMTLNKAVQTYAAYAKEAGIETGKRSRKPEALELIGELDGTETAVDLGERITKVVEQLGVTKDTARGYIKGVYETNDWTMPAVGSASEEMLEWLVENHDCTQDEFKTFASGLGRSSSNINEYWKGMTLHRRILAKLEAEAEA